MICAEILKYGQKCPVCSHPRLLKFLYLEIETGCLNFVKSVHKLGDYLAKKPCNLAINSGVKALLLRLWNLLMPSSPGN